MNNSQHKALNLAPWLVPMLLLFTLSQNYFDLQSVMAGEALRLNENQSPLAIKFLKDISYACFITSVLYFSYKHSFPLFGFTFIAFISTILVLAIFTLREYDITTSLAGIRWAVPLLIFLISPNWAEHFSYRAAVKWLFGGLFVCLAVQVYQLFFMPPVYGVIFGLSARTPGIYLAPNSAAFFGCALAAFIMTVARTNKKFALSAVLMSTAISLLAQSGTGIVVSALLIALVFTTKNHLFILVFAALPVFLVFQNLDAITMRDNMTEISGGDRVTVFLRIASDNFLSFDRFGFYTNAATLTSDTGRYRTAVDSLYASWIGNFGVFALPMAMSLFLFVFVRREEFEARYLYPPLAVFLLFSLSTISFEAYPMNLILGLAIWGARDRERLDLSRGGAYYAR